MICSLQLTPAYRWLKVHGHIFSEFVFLIDLENHHSKDMNLTFLVETAKPFECTGQFCILQLPISYSVSLIMVTI